MNKPLIDDAGEVRELTGADFAQFRPATDVMGADFMAKVRGKQKAPTKIATTVRLDSQIIEYFKKDGKGWQTRLNSALREYIATH